MKKVINVFIIIIMVVLLTACTNDTKNEPEEETLKEQLDNTLITIAKEQYDNIKYDNGTTIFLSLEDIEKVYKLDISKFKTEELGCDLKMSYVKLEVKNNKKTYSTNLNCSGLVE